MKTNKHNTRRAFVAWLLLVLFMLPIATKAMHVCHLDSVSSCDTAKATTHHPDSCSICQFAFLVFDKAENMVLGALIAVWVYALTFFFGTRQPKAELAIVSLRAPPYL